MESKGVYQSRLAPVAKQSIYLIFQSGELCNFNKRKRCSHFKLQHLHVCYVIFESI